MAQIYYRGMLAGIHSWALVGIKICETLDSLGFNVAIQSTNGVEGLSDRLQQIVNPLHEPAIGLSYTIPPNVKKLGTSKIVQIYNYETTVLPPGWAKIMNESVDLILPSSQFSYSIFAKNGVNKDKMHIVPHGFDPKIYSIEGDKYSLGTDKFKILVVAAPHARKAFGLLLRAIGEAFASTEKVCIVIRTGLIRHKRNNYDVQIDKVIAETRKHVKLPEIKLITEELSHIAPLYRACDMIVSASRSECFCLPLLEAAACGLPIVTTGYGGQMDYLNGENAYPIKYSLINAPPSMQYWHHDVRSFIAEPDREHLKATLRYVYAHYHEAQQKANRAQMLVHAQYTWEHAALELVEAVNQQDWGPHYLLSSSDATEVESRHTQGQQIHTVLEHNLTAQDIKAEQQEIDHIQETIEKLTSQLQDKKTQLLKKKDSDGSISKNSETQPVVSIVIPVFNQVEYTQKCIISIKKHTALPIEIIIVDNNSSDDTQIFLSQYSDIKVVKNERNLGFAKACNQGMRIAQAPYVLLLNNDTEVQGDKWLTRMIGAINQSPYVGAVGIAGGILDEQYNFVRETRNPDETFDYLVGYCVLIKSEVIARLGYFDERFDIAYYEDVDYSFRLKQSNFQAWIVPDVELHHHGKRTTLRAVSLHRVYRQNRTRFIAKWGQKRPQPEPISPPMVNNPPLTTKLKKGKFSIAYVMMDVGLTGGSKIIFEHINRLVAAGHTVNLLITGRYHASVAFPLHIKPIRVTKGRLKEYLRFANIAVATFWPTVYMIEEAIRNASACRMVYMIQGWEPFFYTKQQLEERGKAERTYALPMEKIVVSTWLQDKLKQQFDADSELIINTIDTTIFKPIGEKSERPKKALFLLRNESTLRGYEKAVSLAQLLHNRLGMEIHAFGTIKPKDFPVPHKFHYRPVGQALAQLYSMCHLYVETSKWQGFGLAPLEAMACGTPCILSDSGGIREYVRHNENAFVHSFDEGDDQYLYSAKKLLKDPQLYQRIRDAGIQTAQQFDHDVVNSGIETNVVAKLERVFRKALSL